MHSSLWLLDAGPLLHPAGVQVWTSRSAERRRRTDRQWIGTACAGCEIICQSSSADTARLHGRHMHECDHTQLRSRPTITRRGQANQLGGRRALPGAPQIGHEGQAARRPGASLGHAASSTEPEWVCLAASWASRELQESPSESSVSLLFGHEKRSLLVVG